MITVDQALDQAAPETNEIELTTAQEIDAAAVVIFDFIQVQGRATKNEIRTYCKQAGIDTSGYQKAVEWLHRRMRVLTEVTNEDGGKAFAIKDWARIMSIRGVPLAAIIAATQAGASDVKPREVFADWFTLTGTMRLTSPCLASNPSLTDSTAREFLSDDQYVILLSGYYDAMLKAALQMPNAPNFGTARYRIRFDEQSVPQKWLSVLLRPVPPSRPGGSGQGVTTCQAFTAGTELPFTVTAPGSHISAAELEEALLIAGRWVGFSPSAAHKGFGRFQLRMGDFPMSQ